MGIDLFNKKGKFRKKGEEAPKRTSPRSIANTKFVGLIKSVLKDFGYNKDSVERATEMIYRKYYDYMINQHSHLKQWLNDKNYKKWIDEMVQNIYQVNELSDLVEKIRLKEKPKEVSESQLMRELLKKGDIPLTEQEMSPDQQKILKTVFDKSVNKFITDYFELVSSTSNDEDEFKPPKNEELDSIADSVVIDFINTIETSFRVDKKMAETVADVFAESYFGMDPFYAAKQELEHKVNSVKYDVGQPWKK